MVSTVDIQNATYIAWWRPDITTLTGGGSTALDSIATTSMSANRIVEFDQTGVGKVSYKLKVGTNTESSPGIILPDDYNASTNAKYWEQVL